MKITGRFTRASRGRTGCVIVPADLVTDSTFPFEYGDQVEIRIEDGRLIVSGIPKA